jgi:hypothetical protein
LPARLRTSFSVGNGREASLKSSEPKPRLLFAPIAPYSDRSHSDMTA